MPADLTYSDKSSRITCGKIIDKQHSYHTEILIGGWSGYQPIVWDIEHHTTFETNRTKDSQGSIQFHSLDENTLIMVDTALVYSSPTKIYTYTYEYGFVEIGEFQEGHELGAATFLAPRRYATCLA